MATLRSWCWCLLLVTACSASDREGQRDETPVGGAAAAAGSSGESGASGAASGSGGFGNPETGGASGVLAGSSGTFAEGDACASAEVETSRVIPTVWLLVDGSGSMAAPLGTVELTSRWTALRDSLLAADGLITRLQGAVAFGLFVYDGGLSLPGIPGPQCPRVVTVDPALGNFSALHAAYPELETGASTPTHYALLALQERIAVTPSTTGPTYVVLATDGGPNLCDFHDGIPTTPDTEAEAIATVHQLRDAGIQSFVVSLAGDDPFLQAHLDAVAVAGGTGTEVFTPESQSDLVDSLTAIIGATASCDVQLHGRVQPGRDCTGVVTLEDRELACNDADGYRLKDDRQTLELTGSACVALQQATNAKLSASFPCADLAPQ